MHRPRASRALLVVAAWTGTALLLATQAYFAGAVRGESIGWRRTLSIWLAWAAVWALLTPAVVALVARFPLERPRLPRSILAHIAGSVGLVVVDLGLFALVAPHVGASSAGPSWLATFSRLLGTTFFLSLPIYWILVGALTAMHLARAARERERRTIRLEAQLSEARLAALQAQLQPHFLFNALNSVSVLMHEDIEAADRVLVQLSALLRRTCQTAIAQEVALREEVAFLEAYLAIEQVRFEDRLAVRVDVAPEVEDALVPSLILQPLVENAVRHGLAASPGPGRIEITAMRRGPMLELTVRDDGPGLSPNFMEGVGLSNTRSRLEQLYAGNHSFLLSRAAGGGLAVTVTIPCRTRTVA